MSIGPSPDIASLLEPIPGPDPAGRSLAYEPEYDRLREARRHEEGANQGDWQRATKAANWDEVIDLGGRLLRERSKDLMIAAWVAEALARRRGLPGLRDGLDLLRGLVEGFWDGVFPEAEDGDLEPRAAAFEFLASERVLPLLLWGLPLTDGFGEKRYSYLRRKEARDVDNAGRQDPARRDALLAEGKITGELFEEALRQTPRAFYERLAAELADARAALAALDRALDARFGRDAPSLAPIRKAFENLHEVVGPALARKRQEEPDAEAEAEGQPEPDEPDAEATGTAEEVESPPSPEAAAPAPSRPRRATGPATLATADDARRAIAEAAAFLRQSDPSDPAAYLVVRALRQGALFGIGDAPAAADLPAPSSERRRALKALLAEGRWAELLDAAEAALAAPEGRGWLDPHRHAAIALDHLDDADRAPAARAVRSWLRALLREVPALAGAELADDTPAAGGDTRAWLAAEIVPPESDPAPDLPEPEAPAYVPPAPAPPAVSGEPDDHDLALEEFRAGQAGAAIARLRGALARAGPGRERFRRKLQLAELCLQAGRAGVARPLLEDLAAQVDEYRLERWEGEEFCARVWGALYGCLRAGGEAVAPERLAAVYDRLCRLDVEQALRYGET